MTTLVGRFQLSAIAVVGVRISAIPSVPSIIVRVVPGNAMIIPVMAAIVVVIIRALHNDRRRPCDNHGARRHDNLRRTNRRGRHDDWRGNRSVNGRGGDHRLFTSG